MEAFSFKKLLSAPFTDLYWVKCMMMGLGIGMLIFVGYGMYKAFIKITPTTHQDAERIEIITIIQKLRLDALMYGRIRRMGQDED